MTARCVFRCENLVGTFRLLATLFLHLLLLLLSFHFWAGDEKEKKENEIGMENTDETDELSAVNYFECDSCS